MLISIAWGGGPTRKVTINPPGIRGTKSQASVWIAGSQWWAEVLTQIVSGPCRGGWISVFQRACTCGHPDSGAASVWSTKLSVLIQQMGVWEGGSKGAFVSVTCVHEGSEIMNGFEEL